MRFQAVVFDLDGTLLDTIEDLTDSMNAALAAMDFPGRSVEEAKRMVGDGLDLFVRRALPDEARDDSRAAARLKELMRSEYGIRRAVKTKPYEEIPALLEALGRRDIPMAVLSNKPHQETVILIKKYFPGVEFRAVLGAREGVPPKPEPSAALEIARGFGVRPGEIIYLGDTNTDMQTAGAAGMFAVGALWGFRSAEELKAHGAQVLLQNPLDLLSLLED
jgi:phosphoglycolate phosphatase